MTKRAERLVALVRGFADARIELTEGLAGGGALPGRAIESRGVSVALRGFSANDLARRLRLNRPSIVGRVQCERLLLDMLTVGDDELEPVAAALQGLSGTDPVA